MWFSKTDLSEKRNQIHMEKNIHNYPWSGQQTPGTNRDLKQIWKKERNFICTLSRIEIHERLF